PGGPPRDRVRTCGQAGERLSIRRMSESSDDPALREAHSHFTSLYGVAKYLSAFWLGAWLIAISYHEKMWWYLAGAVTFLVATIVRPAFRFLWKHTDWFRVLTVFQCALTAAA